MARFCIETALDSHHTTRSSGGLFRFIVLGLLHACGPQHGYGLMKAFERRSGLRVSSGNFYRELRRLVGEGLVTTAPRTGKRGDLRRLGYEISAAGVVMFEDWFGTSPPLAGRGPDDLSARTLFFGDANEETVVRLLEVWERDVWFQSKVLERTRAAAQKTANGHEFAVLPLLLSRQVRHLALDVEFLNQVRVALRDWAAQRNRQPAATTGVVSGENPRARRPRKREPGHAALEHPELEVR